MLAHKESRGRCFYAQAEMRSRRQALEDEAKCEGLVSGGRAYYDKFNHEMLVLKNSNVIYWRLSGLFVTSALSRKWCLRGQITYECYSGSLGNLYI
jgi:hypothetical protein